MEEAFDKERLRLKEEEKQEEEKENHLKKDKKVKKAKKKKEKSKSRKHEEWDEYQDEEEEEEIEEEIREPFDIPSQQPTPSLPKAKAFDPENPVESIYNAVANYDLMEDIIGQKVCADAENYCMREKDVLSSENILCFNNTFSLEYALRLYAHYVSNFGRSENILAIEEDLYDLLMKKDQQKVHQLMQKQQGETKSELEEEYLYRKQILFEMTISLFIELANVHCNAPIDIQNEGCTCNSDIHYKRMFVKHFGFPVDRDKFFYRNAGFALIKKFDCLKFLFDQRRWIVINEYEACLPHMQEIKKCCALTSTMDIREHNAVDFSNIQIPLSHRDRKCVCFDPKYTMSVDEIVIRAERRKSKRTIKQAIKMGTNSDKDGSMKALSTEQAILQQMGINSKDFKDLDSRFKFI